MATTQIVVLVSQLEAYTAAVLESPWFFSGLAVAASGVFSWITSDENLDATPNGKKLFMETV